MSVVTAAWKSLTNEDTVSLDILKCINNYFKYIIIRNLFFLKISRLDLG